MTGRGAHAAEHDGASIRHSLAVQPRRETYDQPERHLELAHVGCGLAPKLPISGHVKPRLEWLDGPEGRERTTAIQFENGVFGLGTWTSAIWGWVYKNSSAGVARPGPRGRSSAALERPLSSIACFREPQPGCI